MTGEQTDLDSRPSATWKLWAAPALIALLVLTAVLSLQDGETVTGWLLILTAIGVLARWIGSVREWWLWR